MLELSRHEHTVNEIESQIDDPAHHHIALIAKEGIAAAQLRRKTGILLQPQVPVQGNLGKIDAGPEYRFCGAVEFFRPANQDNKGKAQGDPDGQNLLEPEIDGGQLQAEAKRQNLKHGGCNGHQRSQPGQRVFPAEIKASCLIHYFSPLSVIIISTEHNQSLKW